MEEIILNKNPSFILGKPPDYLTLHPFPTPRRCYLPSFTPLISLNHGRSQGTTCLGLINHVAHFAALQGAFASVRET